VRIIVGSAAGSAPDILARLIAEWLSGRLGQPFVVENRPGAGGNVATEAVVKAVADGHTLLLATLADAVNATLHSDPHYNFVRDIAPVASISRDPNCDGCESVVPEQDGSEVYYVCEDASGTTHYGVAGRWYLASSGGRTV